MKNLKYIVIFFLFVNFISAQTRCVRGNCKDTFSFQELANSYQVGFYQNGVLDGLGVQVEMGKEYFGQYIKGKKEGLFYYKVNGETTYGAFKNDLPVGLHVARVKTGYDYRNYDEKGKFINTSPLVTNAVNTGCIQGNCTNGFGVYRDENDNFLQGNFKNGILEGSVFMYRTKEKRMVYCEMKQGKIHGLAIVVEFDGAINMATLTPKKEGQSIYRTANTKYTGYMYKNDQIVETY